MGTGATNTANLQALAALGVTARVVTPGTIGVPLDGELRRRLNTTHQLVVRDVTVGPARECHCRRCGYTWKTKIATGNPVPLRCPNCRSAEWGRWRIFKCAWCGHEFETANLDARPARIFPVCPCCKLANWETGRPRGKTGWLDRLLAALAGTA
jgi:predicted Zn-ribbon and HTH transcriptional regulator